MYTRLFYHGVATYSFLQNHVRTEDGRTPASLVGTDTYSDNATPTAKTRVDRRFAGRRRIPRAHTCTLSLFLHIVATTFESRHLSFYTHVILQHGSYASSATLAEASLAVCKATFSIPTESQHTFQLSSIADLT